MTSQLATVLGALLGSGLLSAIVTNWMTRRTNKSVEQLKARLERGLYVTKAHYDLELESFRSLWTAVSRIQLKARAFIAPDKFRIKTPEGEDLDWYVRAFPGVTKDFLDEHNALVRAVTETAPFYPANIKKAAEAILDIDLQCIRRLSNIDGTEMSDQWFEDFRTISGALDRQAHEVEQLIRARLESLRIVA
jgi:hypothetical protein